MQEQGEAVARIEDQVDLAATTIQAGGQELKSVSGLMSQLLTCSSTTIVNRPFPSIASNCDVIGVKGGH